jgi:hypothetical protein
MFLPSCKLLVTLSYNVFICTVPLKHLYILAVKKICLSFRLHMCTHIHVCRSMPALISVTDILTFTYSLRSAHSHACHFKNHFLGPEASKIYLPIKILRLISYFITVPSLCYIHGKYVQRLDVLAMMTGGVICEFHFVSMLRCKQLQSPHYA